MNWSNLLAPPQSLGREPERHVDENVTTREVVWALYVGSHRRTGGPMGRSIGRSNRRDRIEPPNEARQGGDGALAKYPLVSVGARRVLTSRAQRPKGRGFSNETASK